MKKDDYTILITGGTGFIGKHLIERLRASPYQLKCIYRGEHPRKDTSRIKWVKIEDFTDQASWSKALKNVHFVIHLAALAHQIGDNELSIQDYERANTLPVRKIAKAALENSVKRVIFISSVAAVGPPQNGDTVSDTTPPNPDTPYGISKLEAEKALNEVLGESDNTDWVTLRPSLVYGPGNPGNMDRIARLVSLRIPLPFGAIENQRNFLYVENLISAIFKTIDCPVLSRQSYLVSDDETVSTLELARLIARAKGYQLHSIPIPITLLWVAAKTGDLVKRLTGKAIGIDTYSLEKLKASLCVNNTRFKNEANWTPPHSLQTGIERTFTSLSK